MKTLFFCLVVYVCLTLIMFLWQRKLLYLPQDYQISERQAAEYNLQHWPSPSNFQGFIDKNTSKSKASGTMIVFHGNAGAAYHRKFYIDALKPLGLRVILAEYPGYGGREGQPTEETFVADALNTIAYALDHYQKPIYLWGESLGAGVVSSVVSKADFDIDGLVLFLPWDSLGSLAQTHYWYLPARWLVRDKYDNVKNLQNYDGKIAVVLAGRDEVIPKQHGENLYNSLQGEKKLWVIEGASHNTVPVSHEQSWWQEIMKFLQTRAD